jgi:hypothetical protein
MEEILMRKLLVLFAFLLFLPACEKADNALATSIKSAWLTSNAPTLTQTFSTNADNLSTKTPPPPFVTPFAATPIQLIPIDLKAVAIDYADLGTRSDLYSSTYLETMQGSSSNKSAKYLQVFREFKAKNRIGDLLIFLVRFPAGHEDQIAKNTSTDYTKRFGTILNPSSMELPPDISMFNDGSNLVVVFSQSHIMVQMVLSLESDKISDSIYLYGESDFLFQLAQRQWQRIVEASANQ